ncbi:MAG TPA: hypothetical protein PKX91_01725 [Clostridia bacterium]|jgi:hypothetical protein|nr:hypothetical protein [Clostridia bacterium]
MSKKKLAEEKIYKARMVKDYSLYTAQEVFEQGLGDEEFIDPENTWSLTFVAPYSRQGRTDKETKGADKPRVYVNAYFRRKLSLKDHHELYPINVSLVRAEHTVHKKDSAWHDGWKNKVSSFCEIEKRFYPNDVPQESGYKIADAYYKDTSTVIEFQKSFADDALEKSAFYKAKNIRLIWLFYLQTLAVFKDDDKYKIREDNLYHFFRIEDIKPGFYKDNVIFIQDKTGKIYYVDNLKRVESNSILEATIRYFECKQVFDSADVFVHWLRYDWVNSELFNKHLKSVNKKAKKVVKEGGEPKTPRKKSEVKGSEKKKAPTLVLIKEVVIGLYSLDEIFDQFKGKEDKMFFLQNGKKTDRNGNNLIYCFVKDDGTEFRKDGSSYVSYRCFDKNKSGQYIVNRNWDETRQNPHEAKWLLLETNLQKYSDEIKIPHKQKDAK